jgi:hypothetical protein
MSAKIPASATSTPAGTESGLLVRQVGSHDVNLPMHVDPQFPNIDLIADGQYVPPSVDSQGSLITRGSVLTDEGSDRFVFPGTSLLNSIGSVTVSGNIVTGTFTYLMDCLCGDYFKFDADAETAFVRISEVTTTKIYLDSNYTGATSTGAASRSKFKTSSLSGVSSSVTGGILALISGTGGTVGYHSIYRECDVLPATFRANYALVGNYNTQVIYLGFRDTRSTPDQARFFANFVFSAATSNQVLCYTAYNPILAATGASYTEGGSTFITLPNGATTASYNDYRIEITNDSVIYFINDIKVAKHTTKIPSPKSKLSMGIWQQIIGATTSSSSAINYMSVKNHNVLQVGMFANEEKVIAQNANGDIFNYTFTGVVAANTVLLTIDCSKYASVLIHNTSQGTGGSQNMRWSSDGVTWVYGQYQCLSTPAIYSAGSGIAMTVVGIYVAPVIAKYIQIYQNLASTAGTTTIVVTGSQVACQLTNNTVSGPALNAALVAGINPILVAGSDGANMRSISTTAAGAVNVVTTGTTTATLAASSTITPIPLATQGSATYHTLLSAATTNATSVKASAGVIGMLELTNTSATGKWFKLCNLAAAPTVGTTSPVQNYYIPPTSNRSVDCGPFGLRMSTGIAYAITGAAALLDTTVVAAGDVAVNIVYT